MKREDLRIRDPFVLVEEGKYYLIGTTGDDPWHKGSNLDLYVSGDLENFELVCRMVEEDTLADYTEIWAPELHQYNGRYYLILSLFHKDLGRGSMILSSPSLTEKFKPLTGEYVTPAGWWCLDASFFVWKGKPYLFFSNEWIHTVGLDGDGSLFVAALSDDLKRIVGEPKKIVSGMHCGFSKLCDYKDGISGYVAEGPYAVEEGGRIALYWSTFTQEGYCVCKNVAEDIFGDYAFEKFVFTADGGHAMVFTDLKGARKITFHQPNGFPLERMKIFDL